MFVALLLGALENHLLRQPIDGHREHQADQRPQANFVRRRDHQVKRYGPLVVHEIVDREITCRGVLRDQRIAVERERGFGSGEDAAEIAILFVEHLLHLLRTTGWVRVRSPVGMRQSCTMSRIVLEVQQSSSVSRKPRTGPCEDMRQIGETRDAAFERCFVADMQNHSRRDGRGGILPVAFLRAVFAGADDHVGDVLRVGHSRGVNRRTSPRGLNRELACSSTGENLKQRLPCWVRKPAVFAQFSPLMS